MGDTGFEPGTSASEVWRATNEPPYLTKIKITFRTKTSTPASIFHSNQGLFPDPSYSFKTFKLKIILPILQRNISAPLHRLRLRNKYRMDYSVLRIWAILAGAKIRSA